MIYSTKKFLLIANEWVNGSLDSLESLENRLIVWFCFTFNTTPNDPRLLDMTLEELILLNQIHKAKDNPGQVAEELDPGLSYETWLKKEMGDKYITEKEMVEQISDLKKEDEYPTSISTDFSLIKDYI